ncbi:LysR substrate-binding domain-containing protein [Acidovorax soli]|uniref:DNA-binding transcriptional regulator, LysR family n=1 Tax=Acidovorax soli TaxID=592050 RepID=A0A1H4BYD8_9BURK|nr:LysR substrate-binding domain-containing protein [Acidovorax soli]SEA53136.1 DNA-binding transcriptional regulator, LysR family [Acidovorax soli]
MNERLQGIEAFAAAVEAGSFALAASRLGRTRSAVGKSIARLEQRLAVRLFHRTTRSQSLTDDGQAYYERCRRALDELVAADAAIEAGRHAPVGTLRMSMPALFGRVCIAPLLLDLARDHEGLRLDLQFSDRRVDLVEERVDLAIRSGPLTDSSTLAARLLGHQWMGLYAAPGYLARHGRPAHWQALVDTAGSHRFACYGHDEQRPPSWPYHDGATGELREFEVPARVRCDSLEVLAASAEAGLDITRIPQWLAAPAVAAGTLVKLFDEAQPYGYALHAVWPSTRTLPHRTRVVIDTLAARLPALLGSAHPLPRSAGR